MCIEVSKESLIEKLGFNASDKVIIFHIDDMGFSHASNVASFECLDFGVATCGSVIVPSPWFLETANICKKNSQYDVGVHLTLTCEYDLYRWRAISSVDPKTGLLDHEGCLWRTSEAAVENISTEAAEFEMRAQIQRAINHGIDVTHIDTHMGTVMNPKYIQSYLTLSQEFKVPAFMPRVTREQLIEIGLGEFADIYLGFLTQLENDGFPLIDQMIIDTGGEQPNKVEYYCDRLKEVKEGLTHLLFHPAKMSEELKAITPESSGWRNQDYEAFTSSELKEYIEELGFKIIGYRKIRDLIRKA
ncbi:MAG: ChbG/HpnK family deacetylase [Candidatus Heimdallarchaeota archaeon]|nr:ChbG/HpnK family deacetylase [Candidatus Heimdallarchaeota archaeon]